MPTGLSSSLGLLPNYTLSDTTTQLEATLSWTEQPETEGAKKTYHSEVRDYERSRRSALSELAPGNSFYVNGYKHVVRALDIGSPERRAWSVWRLCPACGYVRTENAQADASPCPRCGGREIADAGFVSSAFSNRSGSCHATSGTTPGSATTRTSVTARGTPS